jgi:hypothetical protein
MKIITSENIPIKQNFRPRQNNNECHNKKIKQNLNKNFYKNSRMPHKKGKTTKYEWAQGAYTLLALTAQELG